MHIGSAQSMDLISPKSLSLVQTSLSNNFMNGVPVGGGISSIMTGTACSDKLDDHNYTLGVGGPLLSGRPEEDIKNSLPDSPKKQSNDSPNEFPLSDTQLKELEYDNNLRELMTDDTYDKLNLDNEYAVKNLVMLGEQTSSDTNFPLSNYNLADIERINPFDCSILNSEENSNSKEYLDSTSSSIEQETQNTPNETNPWAEFIANENPNHKVIVLSNEQCLTPSFSITQNDFIDSFSHKTVETSTPVKSSTSEVCLPQIISETELPKKAEEAVEICTNKTNLRKNKKNVSDKPVQKRSCLK
ncbi:hypothetical protein NQ314_005654 [Rhamnusium bicolor]|uniref:Uncharacterized protein n=1 Tax=Rhamnusium bicolor TaxID=1586634 RepID=A0AAV8ZHZ9_9CUCU|nr:hypothetical protein NQ314_005654 [Rhamnusium bicolor]